MQCRACRSVLRYFTGQGGPPECGKGKSEGASTPPIGHTPGRPKGQEGNKARARCAGLGPLNGPMRPRKGQSPHGFVCILRKAPGNRAAELGRRGHMQLGNTGGGCRWLLVGAAAVHGPETSPSYATIFTPCMSPAHPHCHRHAALMRVPATVIHFVPRNGADV